MLSIERELTVTAGANPAPLVIAATVYAPAVNPGSIDLIYFCVPGGGLTRRYFDLVTADGDERYSFARAAVASGALVVAIDPAGTGTSGAPEDAYTLDPETMAACHAAALAAVLAWLRAGTLDPAVPPARASASVIGLGHSIGALLLTLQQAHHGQFDALALLGFSQIGMPQALPAEARFLLDDPAARSQVESIARRVHQAPWFELPTGQGAGEVYGGRAIPAAQASLKSCGTRLLATASLAVLIPRLYRLECERIDLPLFSAFGDKDICGSRDDILASFPNAARHHVQVLADTGHTHFIFASAPGLFAELLAWAQRVTVAQAGARAGY